MLASTNRKGGGEELGMGGGKGERRGDHEREKEKEQAHVVLAGYFGVSYPHCQVSLMHASLCLTLVEIMKLKDLWLVGEGGNPLNSPFP